MSSSTRTAAKVLGLLLVVSAAVIGVGLSADTQEVDSVVPVDNNSSTIYIDFNGSDMTQNRTADVDITGRPVGVSTENGTTLVNKSVTVVAGETTSVEYDLNDSEQADYDDAAIRVWYPKNHTSNVTISSGITQEATGGGGGLFGGSLLGGSGAGPVIVVFAVATFLFLAMKED